MSWNLLKSAYTRVLLSPPTGPSLVVFMLLYNQHIQRMHELNEEMSSRIPQFHPHNDWLLGLLIGGLFLLPTFVLIWMIRESEPAYTTYSRILLALSID